MNGELYDQSLDNYNWLADQVDFHETDQAMALGALLFEKLGPKSVIDVGCSSGIYLVPFAQRGIEVYGVDGASGVGKWIPGNFGVVDLRQPWKPSKRYDLAYCIEVAEHIHCEYQDTLVQTLVDCSDTIFFSAAHPGQGGEGHFCEQPMSYWLNKFAAHGYGSHPMHADVQSSILGGQEYTHCHWLQWHSALITKGN